MDQPDPGTLPIDGASRPLEPGALRWQTADVLRDRADSIVTDAVAAFPYSARLEIDCLPLGAAFVRLVAETVRRGQCDPRSGGVVDLISLVERVGLATDQVFAFAYSIMTSAVDELSIHSEIGSTTARWPVVADAVRRAVFDVLAAWTTRVFETPSASSITDTLTTLHTRAVLDAVLRKECQRAERFEHWLSMLLIDVDDLSDINRIRGYGVGDRVLERMGILIRKYFRQHDWVARYSEDAIAVVLPETGPEDAATLANLMRTMVQERLTFEDYRTDQRAAVTVSVAVVSARPFDSHPIDPERFLVELDAAVERAKTAGANRIEAVEIHPKRD